MRKTRLFLPVYFALSFLTPNLRAKRRREVKELARIKAVIGNTLKTPLYDSKKPDKSVLVMSLGYVRFIAQEVILRKSFELAGYRCQVIIPPDISVIQAYRQLGSDKLVFMDHYQGSEQRKGVRMVNDCHTIEDVIDLKHDGVRFGKYAVSTLMRKTRSGSLDLSDKVVRKQLAGAIDNSLQTIKTAQAVLQKTKPNAIVLTDRGYTPSGEFFDICIQRGIPAFTWNVAHRNDSLMLKRYSLSNADAHPSSLSKKTWEKIKKMPWSMKKSQRVLKELKQCYKSGEWYGEVGTQTNTHDAKKKMVLKGLRINPPKKTIAIFPHIFWDATFFWGKDLFESYEQWFIETIKIACKNRDVNWIVKVHPANIVKNIRDGVHAEHSELTTIKQKIGKLPDHVKLIKANTKISTFSILQTVDACITVRGTIGIEAACLGLPVLTAVS